MNFQIFVILSCWLLVLTVSGASIIDVIKRTNSGENTEKRALGEGCYDDYGRHYSVGQRWRVNGGSCACYRFGTIGCVGEPVTAAPPVTATIRYKRTVEDGCHDENGKHYSVGESWRMEFGSCQCYEDGSIGCVGIPLTAAQPVTATIALPEERSLPDGCHDTDGVHHSVGEGWKVESGYCKCYERGNIWCVGDPVTAPPQYECTYKGQSYPPGKYLFDGCIRCFCDGRRGEHVCTTYDCQY